MPPKTTNLVPPVRDGNRVGTKKASLPPFAYVPSRAYADARLSKTDHRVFGALCARRNKKTGACFPSHERISADTGIHLPHVKKALLRLEEFGYIVRYRRVDDNGKDLSNTYDITAFGEGDESCSPRGDKTCIPEGDGTCSPNIELKHRKNNIPPKEQAVPLALAADRFPNSVVADGLSDEERNTVHRHLRALDDGLNADNWSDTLEETLELSNAYKGRETSVVRHAWRVCVKASKYNAGDYGEYDDPDVVEESAFEARKEAMFR